MSRFKIKHPADEATRAHYGTDPFLSWWVEVHQKDKVIESYDGISPDDSTMEGLLRVLVRHGFFSEFDVAEAHSWLPHVEDLSEIGDGEDKEADESVQRAATVISNLKGAAAD
ncbi:MAG: hypothetical protein HYV07_28690 [Deltaproteobacteria bacterium]|nr:hypothetical protein [Deltaproteobacteria bacterium]